MTGLLHVSIHVTVLLLALMLGLFLGTKPSIKKIVTDTLQENGSWSMGRLSILIVLSFNLAFAAYVAYKTNVMPDLPPNWLILLCTLWGIAKAAMTATQYITAQKGTPDG